MDWKDEDRSKDLNILIDHVYPVEEFNITLIKDLCFDYDIESRNFCEAWQHLLDEAHEIINRAEDKL
jgi:hypothetical protein